MCPVVQLLGFHGGSFFGIIIDTAEGELNGPVVSQDFPGGGENGCEIRMIYIFRPAIEDVFPPVRISVAVVVPKID